jgi:copper chaperone
MTVFQVPDMTCGHCEGTIRKWLGHVPGVDTIDVDRSKRNVIVTGAATADALKAAIERAGFTPRELPAPG